MSYNDFKPNDAHRHYHTRHCSYGNPSEYNVLYEDTGYRSIAFEQDLASIGKAAFVAIVLGFFSVPVGVAGSIIYAAYDRMKNRNSRARAMGARERKYHHYKGRIVKPGLVYKCVIDLYYDKECNSYIDKDQVYEIFSW